MSSLPGDEPLTQEAPAGDAPQEATDDKESGTSMVLRSGNESLPEPMVELNGGEVPVSVQQQQVTVDVVGTSSPCADATDSAQKEVTEEASEESTKVENESVQEKPFSSAEKILTGETNNELVVDKAKSTEEKTEAVASAQEVQGSQEEENDELLSVKKISATSAEETRVERETTTTETATREDKEQDRRGEGNDELPVSNSSPVENNGSATTNAAKTEAKEEEKAGGSAEDVQGNKDGIVELPLADSTPEDGATSAEETKVKDEDPQSPSTSVPSPLAGITPAASMVSSSNDVPPPARLEECLYGPRSLDDETKQDETQHPAEVHDDWHYVRPQGLWKTMPHTIPLGHLRKLASIAGIPEEGSHRAVTWRVLLGYLPTDNTQWPSILEQKRDLYKSFVEDLLHNEPDSGEELRWKRKLPNRARKPMASGFAAEDSVSESSGNNDPDVIAPATQDPTANDSVNSPTITSPIKAEWKKNGLDPRVLENVMKNMNKLSLKELHEEVKNPEEERKTFSFQDFAESAKLLDEIRKDVDRTFPDLAFFLDPDDNLGKRRYAALERILFVWSKYNRGVKYVQGMNEIAGAIYYVLANDWNEEWASHAEADTYWLFNILLADMRDVFVPAMDDADTGIQGRIDTMERLLAKHDPEVKEHLTEVGVECSFFAIRWWTTLLSREFLLPDTIRLWDSLFSSTHKDNFLCYVCVTMVMMIRDDLLKGDFSRCLRLLQAYPSVLMDQLLDSSRSLWVYERQITMACHKGGVSLQQALQTVPPPDSVIMAFGFRNGVVPKTRAELLEEAGERAAASVREATSAMATSAKGWFGKASRLYNKYSSSMRVRSQSSDSILSSDKASDPGEEVNSHDDIDTMYFEAIQQAETGKFSYK